MSYLHIASSISTIIACDWHNTYYTIPQLLIVNNLCLAVKDLTQRIKSVRLNKKTGFSMKFKE